MIYTCGPMLGIDEHNIPAFKLVTRELRKAGYEVVCPTEVSTPEDDYPWHIYLKRDIEQMLRCDTIAYLPGWEKSRGATFEMFIAMILKYEFHEIRIVDQNAGRILTRLGYAPDKSQIVRACISNNIPKLIIRGL